MGFSVSMGVSGYLSVFKGAYGCLYASVIIYRYL